MIVTDCIDAYFALMTERPELFVRVEGYPIVTDCEKLEAYQEEHDIKLGILYRSPYHILILDLIEGENGYFPYERIVTTSKGKGVVCIPMFQDKFILVKQNRHPIRKMQLCFPRGFGEDGISPKENAKKELWEEIGATVKECVSLGAIYADSGVIGDACDVILCRIEGYDREAFSEGIVDIKVLDDAALEEAIKNNEVDDGFTLSAYALLKAKGIEIYSFL